MKQEAQSVSAAVEAIRKVGKERTAVLERLRSALKCGNDSEALKLARLYVGITDEESNRANPRLH